MAESENGSTYDVIVLGAGPVGENAAARAGRHGLRVAIIERRLVGGECSFWACIPSKALLRPVHAAHAAQRVRGVNGATLHPEEVFGRRDHFVSHYDDGGATSWLESAGIDLIRGSGRLTGQRTVEVDGTTYEAQVAVVLATGSAPAIPDIPGLRDAQPWTNVEATAATTVPQRLVVLGGGVVACEMAQVFAALGSSVTVIERGDRLLGRAEPVASALVRDGLKRAGATVRLRRLGRVGVAPLPRRPGVGLPVRRLLGHRRRDPVRPRPDPADRRAGPGLRRAPRSTRAASSRWTTPARSPPCRGSGSTPSATSTAATC